jgi:hypothetical protein
MDEMTTKKTDKKPAKISAKKKPAKARKSRAPRPEKILFVHDVSPEAVAKLQNAWDKLHEVGAIPEYIKPACEFDGIEEFYAADKQPPEPQPDRMLGSDPFAWLKRARQAIVKFFNS